MSLCCMKGLAAHVSAWIVVCITCDAAHCSCSSMQPQSSRSALVHSTCTALLIDHIVVQIITWVTRTAMICTAALS